VTEVAEDSEIVAPAQSGQAWTTEQVADDLSSSEPQAQLADAPPSRPMRIGWVAGEETIERLSRTLKPLAIGLLDEPMEITAICPNRAIITDLPSPPIEIVRYDRMRLSYFRKRAAARLAEELRAYNFDLLHSLDSSAAELTGQLADILNLRYVVSSYRLGDGAAMGTLGGQACCVLAGCEAIRSDLLENHVAAVEKIEVLHPGVYQVGHATLFANPAQSIAIAAGGELNDFPAFEAVLKCFAELKNRQYDCVFFIIGSGKAQRQLRRAAERLGLNSVLTFVDYQQPAHLAGIFKAADIYISPVPDRGINIPVLLAMAAGDPVVAAGSGCSDFIIGDKTALLYRSGDWVELTGRLSGLLDDHAAASQLAENALDYLGEHYSPAGMVSALAGIYRRVCTSRIPSASQGE
jgi:glycosyltransferase involved in cell wall biosynthesis